MTPKSNPTLTKEENKLMKLMGGVDLNVALAKGYRYKVDLKNSNYLSWYYGSTFLISLSRSQATLLTVEKLENIKIIHKVCEEVRVSLLTNSIHTEEGQFDLNNIRVSSMKGGNSLEDHINDLYKERYCWKTKGGEYIPFSELTNAHLANIIGKVPSKIPEGIKQQTKKRFGHVIVNEGMAFFAGCCKEGIKDFKKEYGLKEGWCTLSFLIECISYDPNSIGNLIKKAILKEL